MSLLEWFLIELSSMDTHSGIEVRRSWPPARRARAFTLIEMMIVVAIIGLLAAIAIPAFMTYIRRARSLEALMNLRKLFDSTVSYMESEHAGSDGSILPRTFPTQISWNPARGICCSQPGQKCPPAITTWTDPTWTALNFSIDDPFYYSYDTVNGVGDGTHIGDRYDLEASGDLNCNGIYSLFRRSASIPGGFPIVGGSGVYSELETE